MGKRVDAINESPDWGEVYRRSSPPPKSVSRHRRKTTDDAAIGVTPVRLGYELPECDWYENAPVGPPAHLRRKHPDDRNDEDEDDPTPARGKRGRVRITSR